MPKPTTSIQYHKKGSSSEKEIQVASANNQMNKSPSNFLPGFNLKHQDPKFIGSLTNLSNIERETALQCKEEEEDLQLFRLQKKHKQVLKKVAKQLASIHYIINIENSIGEEPVKTFKPFATSNKKDSTSLASISTNASLSPLNSLKSVKLIKLSRYQRLLSIFSEIGEIEENVFILALIYLNRILESFSLENGKFLKGMYSTCVLLAHKFLIEDEYWPLDEFSKMVGVKE